MAERNLDFDKVINRKNTRCLKYDFAVKRGKPADVLPLWVADKMCIRDSCLTVRRPYQEKHANNL